MKTACLLILGTLVGYCMGDVCKSPKAEVKSYTSTDVMSSVKTVFVVEFKLKCSSTYQNLNLFALANGKVFPVTKSSIASDIFQISLSDESSNIPAGLYTINIYDDDGYASLRKAQRNNDDTSHVSPLVSFSVAHKGMWRGPYVQSETVAAVAVVAVFYTAYRWKQSLLN